MLETILGGVSGLLGSAVTAYSNYKIQKLANEHKQAMANLELEKMDREKEIMLAEAEANMRITEVQTEAQIDIADSQVYIESLKAAQKEAFSDATLQKLLEGGKFSRFIGNILSFLFGLVDFIKRLIRPGLTVYFVVLTSLITYVAWDVVDKHQADLDPTQVIALFDEVTTIIIYLTVTIVTWWFGDRRMAKFLTRLDDGNIKNQSFFKKGDKDE